MSSGSNYRVVRLTHENGVVDYAIQKTRRHWLTGKPETVYYEDCSECYGWTRNVNQAMTWSDYRSADRKVNDLNKVSKRKVVKIEVL